MHDYKIQKSLHFEWYQSIYAIPKLWKEDLESSLNKKQLKTLY